MNATNAADLMCKHPYLFPHGKRGGYLFRRAVPKRLRPILGKSEYNVALDGTDLPKILPRYHQVAAAVERQLEEAQAQLEARPLGQADAECQPPVPSEGKPHRQRF